MGRWSNICIYRITCVNTLCPTSFLFYFLIHKVFSIDTPTAEKLKGWVGGEMTAFAELLTQTLDLSPTLLISLSPLPKSMSNGLLIVKIPKGREGGKIIASASSLTYLSEYLTQWSPQPLDLLTWRLDSAVFGYPHPTLLSWFFSSILHKFLLIIARRKKKLKGWVGRETTSIDQTILFQLPYY